jgi:hypothetical protein
MCVIVPVSDFFVRLIYFDIFNMLKLSLFLM